MCLLSSAQLLRIFAFAVVGVFLFFFCCASLQEGFAAAAEAADGGETRGARAAAGHQSGGSPVSPPVGPPRLVRRHGAEAAAPESHDGLQGREQEGTSACIMHPSR